jgi:putative spermidine/putrescine transport system permease protein
MRPSGTVQEDAPSWGGRSSRAVKPARGRVPRIPYLLVAPMALVYVIALLVPFLFVLVTSLREYTGAFGVGGFVGLENYRTFLTEPGQQAVIFRTARIAGFTTLLCVLIGWPTAYYTMKLRPQWRSVVMLGLLAPLLTSIIARTFGWWAILGPGAIGDWLGSLVGRDRSLLFTETAAVIGMVNLFLPYMVLSVLVALQGIDPNLRRAALSLGAPPLEVIRRVDIPLSIHGLMGGIIIVMSLSLSAFVVPGLLGGSRNHVVATQIHRVGAVYYNRPLSAAGAVMLGVVALVLVYVNLRVAGRSSARRLGTV